MKLTRLVLAGVVSSTMFLTGCVYELTQAEHKKATEFLPESEKLQPQPAKFPFQLFYLKEDAPRLSNIYIAPVNIEYLRKSENWEKFDQKLAGKLGQDVQMLADHMRERLILELNQLDRPQKPKLVTSPATKDCMVLETAIVGIAPNKAELNALGLAGNLLVPGVSVLVARLAAGSISVECKVRNAETGEVIAMYSATVNDQVAVISLKALSWYGSAKRSIERIAKDTITVLATQDYSSIKREYPIKLLTW